MPLIQTTYIQDQQLGGLASGDPPNQHDPVSVNAGGLVDTLATGVAMAPESLVGNEHIGADEDEVSEGHGDSVNAGAGSKKSNKKKRDGSTLRKAPQAPKRFKSSYICFFMAKQSEIKEELGDKATVTEISKRSAEMWRNLSSDDRAHWDDVAAKDKQRYMVEKASYTGPWQVPWKRAKKDPSAPKRPMSAFLYFSQGRRRQIKEANPKMKNTEVSRLLGEMWRNASEEDRRPHIEKEKAEREKYKVAIADWRKDFDARMESERKAQADQAAYMANMYNRDPHSDPHQQGAMYGDQNMMQYPNQPPQMGPPPYGYGAPPSYPYPSPYPPPAGPGPYQFPTNGKQPIILGPNGAPRFQVGYGQGPPAPMQAPMPVPVPYNPTQSQQYEDPSTTHHHHQHQHPPPAPHFEYPPDQVGAEPQTAG